MHCAVSLVREGELSLRDAAAGLALHWRRGLGLAALSGVVVLAGLAGVRAYGGASTFTWPLAFVLAYLLGLFCVYQLVLWPLAIAERDVPLRQVLGDALRMLTGRPRATLALALLLLLVNALGALAALLPLFTLTVAYSFLAAARFAPRRNRFRRPDGTRQLRKTSPRASTGRLPSTTFRWRSRTVSFSSSSVRPAAASRPRCGCSPVSRTSRRAGS